MSNCKKKENLIFRKCENCGYSIYVTRHRVRPGRKSGQYVPWNVVGLCANCHAEAEMKLISPYILQQYIFERIKRNLELQRKKR